MWRVYVGKFIQQRLYKYIQKSTYIESRYKYEKEPQIEGKIL